MFRHILIPIDLTDRHAKALESGIHLARASAGRVTLLHVIELLHGVGRQDEPAFYDRLEEQARTRLAEHAARLNQDRIESRSEVLYGEPGPEILRFAQAHEVDLILLASHPVDPNRPGTSWISLSYFIGIASPCPVLLIK